MKKAVNKIMLIAISLILLIALPACALTNAPVDGKDGLSAYELAVQNGFEGTLEEWLASLKGADGADGEKGARGKDGEDGIDGADGLNAPASLDGQLASSFVVVTEYLQPNTGKDVSNAIQAIIDSNPNRTIYFPDGEYIVSKPIKTSAHYDRSVSLLLSNYAEIKASENWSGDIYDDAIIMLGAAEHYNNIKNPGSNYFLEGGIINGNGIASGVSIDSGRETRIDNVSIKNTVIGLQIKHGANSGSSDADITNVHIRGNGAYNSIGVLIRGYDNTLENMRIANVKTGVQIEAGGNFLRDIHPLVDNMGLYSGCVGFYVSGENWLDNCYSDNFETAFLVDGSRSVFTNCYSFWWYKNSSASGTNKIQKEIGFEFMSKFNSTLQNCRINFTNLDNTENAYLKVAQSGGTGIIFNPMIIDSENDNDTYKDYLVS
jgi:hypothetical protein